MQTKENYHHSLFVCIFLYLCVIKSCHIVAKQ